MRQRKVRVVAFVSEALVKQYGDLSRRFGVSRSELYRMALHRGFRSIAAWCERSEEAIQATEDSSGERSGGTASSGGRSPLTPSDQIVAYCRVLVDQDPDIPFERVREMAKAQAAVVGVPAVEVDEVVESALGVLFPSAVDESENGDDGSGEVTLD